jgi:hypothetical protein
MDRGWSICKLQGSVWHQDIAAVEMEIPTSATYLLENSCVAHKYLTYPYVQRLHNEKVITQVVSSSLKMMNSLAHIQHSGGQLEFFLRVNWYEESDIRELMNMQKGRRNKKERKFQISKLMTLQVCAAL